MGDIMALITRNICMENKYGRPIQSNSYRSVDKFTNTQAHILLFVFTPFFFKPKKSNLTLSYNKNTHPSTRDRIVIFHFVELICARAAL